GGSLRRAVHDGPRRRRRQRARGRSGRSPPPLLLPDVGEQVIPPVEGRPRPSRRRVLTRRILAVAALLAALSAVAWLGAQALGSSSESAPPQPTVAPPPPKPLKIIFPEGFTIDQMAERITAVNQIAREKRDVKPKLREAEYRRLTRRSKLPGQLAGDKKPR